MASGLESSQSVSGQCQVYTSGGLESVGVHIQVFMACGSEISSFGVHSHVNMAGVLEISQSVCIQCQVNISAALKQAKRVLIFPLITFSWTRTVFFSVIRCGFCCSHAKKE